MSINKVILLGHVGADPEIKYIQPDVAMAKLRIATNESYKGKDGEWVERTEWHNIVAFRYAAKKVENSIAKGMLIYVEGKLQTRKWEDDNGNPRYMTEINADSIKIIDKKNQGSNNTGGNTQTSYNDAPQNQAPADNVDPFADDSENETNDDLPF